MKTREIKFELTVLVFAEEAENMDGTDFEDMIQNNLDTADVPESVISYTLVLKSDTQTEEEIEDKREIRTNADYEKQIKERTRGGHEIDFEDLMEDHVSYVEQLLKPYKLELNGVEKFFKDTNEIVPYVQDVLKIKVIT